MRILLTGHSGFKGSWLTLMLKTLGHEVYGLSLPARAQDYLYREWSAKCLSGELHCDIDQYEKTRDFVINTNPDVIVHMAAQAYVPQSYRNPEATYATNVTSTHALLMASLDCEHLKKIICITSDKVYLNLNKGRSFLEDDPLGGLDPYSASKACQEIVCRSWWHSYGRHRGISLISMRAGNVIGGGDYGEDRLIPDVVYQIYRNQPLRLRNPNSTRPWQYILDVLPAYYIALVENSVDGFDSFNIGPISKNPVTVSDIVNLAYKYAVSYDPSIHLYRPETVRPVFDESCFLSIDVSKALSTLKWTPQYDIDEMLGESIELYRKIESNVFDDTPYRQLDRCLQLHRL